MSDGDEEELSPTPPPSFEVQVRLTTYQSVTKKSKKGTKRELKKDPKVKSKDFEYKFASTSENYAQFLNEILQLFGFRVKATAAKIFPMTVQVPPATKSQATDIESLAEYKKLAGKIVEKAPSKPIIVSIDQQEIQKAKLPKATNDGHDTDGSQGRHDGPGALDDSSEEDQDDSELSHMDRELARFRGLLENKYKSDSDNTYAYPDPVTGDPVLLTLFMMKEWARAMYDGATNIDVPPNTATFDCVNRLPSLRQGRRRFSSASAESAPTTDIGHLANILSIMKGDTQPASPPLTTQNVRVPNTPSKLPRFLAYAESELGVSGASSYCRTLEQQKVGPDILHLVPDETLLNLNLPLGDIIRLKQAAPVWIQSSDAKRKDPPPTAGTSDGNPPAKRIRFKKRWHDGSGAASEHGTGMEIGSPPGSDVDYDWWYYSEEAGTLLPVPPNYRPIFPPDDFPF
ncbi:hypothetical protein K435DRAFT_800797 [Dendrothele bispora CBS 962.96]|uniref:Uncharacterized protein n=1 Tax=Dendrothele bispora (strain CBS 962.96) TaxID=1314807 RepID=A0A4S8LSN2_DENBC|nr:hypothetical protein K435DRAFT_800797 [Dendrothele bispora CBS 962.96]